MNQHLWIIGLQYFIVTLDGLTSGLMIEAVTGGVEGKNKWFQRAGRILSFQLMEIILMLPKLILGRATTSGPGQLLQFAGYVFLTRKMYGMKWQSCVNWFFIYLLTGVGGELFCLSCHPDVFMNASNWTRENVLLSLTETELCIFLFKSLYAGLAVQKKRRHWLEPEFLFFAGFSALNLFLYPYLIRSDLLKQNVLIRGYIPLLLLIYLFTFALSCYHWMHVQSRRSISRSLRETESEQIRKHAALQSPEKIKHDAKNIEETLRTLIAEDETEEAIDLLSQIGYDLTAVKSERIAENAVSEEQTESFSQRKELME